VRAELERVVNVQRRVGLELLIAKVEVARKGPRFVARVTTAHAGRVGARILSAPDCAVMVRSVSLVLGLAFGEGTESANPESSNEAPAAESSPPPESGPAVIASESFAPTSAMKPPDVGVWIAGGVGFGLLPAAAFAAEIGIEARFDVFSVGVRGFGWPGVHQQSAELRAGYAAYGGGVRGCGLAALASLELAGCAGLALAAVRGAADGSQAIVADSATAPWYSISAALAVDWPRDARLRLRASGELSVSLNRPHFTIEERETQHRAAALVPFFAAGVLLVL
jgi:hypothetical protein